MAGESEPRAETIGVRLRRLRLERGASQRDLSSPGITYAYISRIEAGARTPSVKALRMLARKLGVTPEYLETGSELDAADCRELRLAEQELRLRLDGRGRRRRGARASAPTPTRPPTSRRRPAPASCSGSRPPRGGDHRGDDRPAVARSSARSSSPPASRPDVYLDARPCVSLRRARRARRSTLFERALDEVGRVEPENMHARVRYSTYLSYALTDLGELQRAKAVVGELFAGGGDGADRYTRVRLYWSLGRLSLEQAKPLAALDSFRRAVALLEATEDTVHLARAHVACADATISAHDDLGGARHHLDEAERLLGPAPAAEDLATIRRLQAMCAAVSADWIVAEHLASAALQLAEDLPNERGAAWLVVAEARAGNGDADGADEAFREALELLADHGTVRQHAAALRSYGRFLRDSGREREALDVFERAAEVTSNLQAESASGV